MNTSTLLERWRRQQRIPGGRKLFSLALARVVPFAMRLKPMVLELDAGHALVRMADRRQVQNHLGHIAPGAMATLGEYTALLAINAGLEEGKTAYVTNLDLGIVGQVGKGSGSLVAECRLERSDDQRAQVRITAEDGVECAVVHVGWTADVEARSSARTEGAQVVPSAHA